MNLWMLAALYRTGFKPVLDTVHWTFWQIQGPYTGKCGDLEGPSLSYMLGGQSSDALWERGHHTT